MIILTCGTKTNSLYDRANSRPVHEYARLSHKTLNALTWFTRCLKLRTSSLVHPGEWTICFVVNKNYCFIYLCGLYKRFFYFSKRTNHTKNIIFIINKTDGTSWSHTYSHCRNALVTRLDSTILFFVSPLYYDGAVSVETCARINHTDGQQHTARLEILIFNTIYKKIN